MRATSYATLPPPMTTTLPATSTSRCGLCPRNPNDFRDCRRDREGRYNGSRTLNEGITWRCTLGGLWHWQVRRRAVGRCGQRTAEVEQVDLSPSAGKGNDPYQRDDPCWLWGLFQVQAVAAGGPRRDPAGRLPLCGAAELARRLGLGQLSGEMRGQRSVFGSRQAVRAEANPRGPLSSWRSRGETGRAGSGSRRSDPTHSRPNRQEVKCRLGSHRPQTDPGRSRYAGLAGRFQAGR